MSEMGTANLNSTPRFPLAEFRYGREEMLSLFDKNNIKIPEVLPKFKKLYIEKVQCPLALTPSTEDDMQRNWIRSVGAAPISSRGARGGSVDRGRGRGRTTFHGLNTVGYVRSNSLFDEENGRRSERSWPERNGTSSSLPNSISNQNTTENTEWNAGSSITSPRRDYSNLHSRTNVENWRKSRSDEETMADGWRSSATRTINNSEKWMRLNSWREDENNSNSFSGSIDKNSKNPDDKVLHRPYDDDLPEWAIEDHHDGGGTFDSSGEFHGSEENDLGIQFVIIDDNYMEDIDEEDDVSYHQNSNKNNESNHKSPNENCYDDLNNESGLNNENSDSNEIKKSDNENSSENDGSASDDDSKKNKDNENEHADAHVNSDSNSEAIEIQAKSKRLKKNKTDNNVEVYEIQKDNNEIPEKLNESEKEIDLKIEESVVNPIVSVIAHENVDQMQVVADDMIEKLIMDDDGITTTNSTNSSVNLNLLMNNPSKFSQNPSPNMYPPSLTTKPDNNLTIPSQNLIIPQNTNQSLAPTVAATISAVPGSGAGTNSAIQNDLWYYHDPQGNVQGPFTASEMAEWYRAGYFDENLYVRRHCDTRYSTLGDLVEICGGGMPFLSSHLIPPRMNHQNPPTPLLVSAPPTVQQAPEVVTNVVGPTPTQNSAGNKNIMDLNYMLQKQYYLRQQSIIQKLSSIEPWNILSSEQQNALVNQHMNQYVLNEQQQQPGLQNLNKLPPVVPPSAQLPHNPQIIAQAGAAAQIKPILKKNHNLNNVTTLMDFIQTPLVQNPPVVPTTNDNLQHMIISQQQQQQQPQAPVHSNIPIENDPIKSLIMQLAMQKNVQSNEMWLPINNTGKPMLTQQPQQQNQNLRIINQNPIIVDPIVNNTGQQIQQQAPVIISSTVTATAVSSSAGNSTTSWNSLNMWNQRLPTNTEIPTTVTTTVLKQSNNLNEENFNSDEHNHNLNKKLKEKQQQQSITLQQNQQKEKIGNDLLKENDKQQESISISSAKCNSSNNDSSNNNVNNNSSFINNSGNNASKKKELKKENEKYKKSIENVKPPNKDDNKDFIVEKSKKAKKQQLLLQQQQQQQQQQNLIDEKQKSQQISEKLDLKSGNATTAVLPTPTQSSGGGKHGGKGQTITTASSSSVAPWSSTGLPGLTSPSLSLAEIQKAEMERRAEQYRIEQNLREQQQQNLLEIQSRENMLIWNSRNILPQTVKSLTEIQAEEHAKQQRDTNNSINSNLSSNVSAANTSNSRDEKSAQQNLNNFSSIWNNTSQNLNWTSNKVWGSHSTSNITSSGFWEEPTKQTNGSAIKNPKTLAKSHTMANIQSNKSNSTNTKQVTNVSSSITNNNNQNIKDFKSAQTKGSTTAKSNTNQIKSSKKINEDVQNNNEFINWCIKALSSITNTVDVPTFATFLQDIESPYEVKDYIKGYLGESREFSEFAKQFLERRSKYKNQQRAQNAHMDDMCSPARAINPGTNDFQEVKGKGKKVKKNKMMKLDSRILGFSVTAAQDRINIGDRDYGDIS